MGEATGEDEAGERARGEGAEGEGAEGEDEAGERARAGRCARRAAKGPKEPTRGVGVDAIAAVSLRSAPPG
jgi:hypothetical protein